MTNKEGIYPEQSRRVDFGKSSVYTKRMNLTTSYVPLAEQLRPTLLTEVVGQDHLVGKDGVLTKLLSKKQLSSFILWGPPGSGKTTIARLIAQEVNAFFNSFSATNTSINDVRKVIAQAKERKQLYNQETILFIDEVHRFNKAQQDAFLPHVENGTIIFIGATTENPSFEVIGPLLSRSRVLVLNRLEESKLDIICARALKKIERSLDKDGYKYLLESANGDARSLLNTLEIANTIQSSPKRISIETIEQALQKKSLLYDREGEEHYNTVSAFIKSMRASDADAALYYLARMVEAGEDPLFIARRMVIFASEDIGMAQPTAFVVANDVFRACETIGYPECQENLAHGTVYLSLAKKDRSAYDAYFNALSDVKTYGNLPIPMNLCNAPTKLMKELGYAKGYEKYPKKNVSLLPERLKGKKYLRVPR